MSAIRTEKHSNRKVLYISDKGEIVNVAKRWGIFLGDGRWAERHYYTEDSAQDAFKELAKNEAIDKYSACVTPVVYYILDDKYQPLPGWHYVIDPQHPHWSIVGSKYQEKWLDKGWEQLRRKIEAQPLQSFKSELQGGLVDSTRTNPPIFHPDRLDIAMYGRYQSKAQEIPCTHETEDQKKLREYIQEGHSVEDWLAMKADQEEINQRIQDAWGKNGWNTPKLQEAIDYAKSAQKHLDNEKQRQGWLEERNYWKLAQASLKSSAPADSPSVLVWGKKAGTQIKLAYHSFFAFLVRALNPHASGSK